MNRTLNLLLVEDSPDDALLLIRHIEKCGYSLCYKIVDTKEAMIDALANSQCDLIISDFVLPKFSGLAALKLMRNRGLDLPFIIVSGKISEDMAVEVMKAGAHDYILKDNLRRLVPAIERELEDARMRSEARAAEAALKDSEKRMVDIIEFLPDPTYAIDRTGRVIVWNKAMEEMTGIKTENILGKGDYEYSIPFYGRRIPMIIDMVLGQDIKKREEFYLIKKENNAVVAECKVPYLQGKEAIISVKSSPLFDAGGNMVRAIESVRDITESKRTQEALIESIENLSKTLDGAVNALSLSAEKRDAYTAGHQERVAGLAVLIGMQMGFSPERLQTLRTAGILHDIGKMHLPLEILNRPGRLSELEMNLIKTHPQVGCEIVTTIPFSGPVSQVVLQHHERINGSGYPYGLSGDKILMEAKILAVADVIEAMASHRPYRPALGLDEAMKEVTRNSGILYDPEVVDVCSRLYKNKELALSRLDKDYAHAN